MKECEITSQDVKERVTYCNQSEEEPYSDWTVVHMITTKFGMSPKEIKMIKDNPLESLELDWDAEPIINLLDPEQFHKHYQELAPTREKQKQQLEQLNARLCQHCLISCNFQYCDDRCASESESIFNPNLNSDNDNNENTNSNSDLNYEQYIALPDLFKEQELK
ncbi:hypothetical protein G9A89_016444 [Geosiphon pyriformis]|nr:hypothetical protein G9A89_016444 [Geosiphon pyriformis]